MFIEDSNVYLYESIKANKENIFTASSKNSFLEEIKQQSLRLNQALQRAGALSKDNPLTTPLEQNPDRAFSWKPRALPIDIAMGKMWQNAKKAIEEHAPKAPSAYAPLSQALPPLEALAGPKASPALHFKTFCRAART